MNGFLSPEGTFYKCSYEEHWELARELMDKFCTEGKYDFTKYKGMNEDSLKAFGFLYLGCTPDLGTNTDSYLFLDFNDMQITEEQKEWVENNKHQITVKQYEKFHEYYKWVKEDEKETKNENN